MTVTNAFIGPPLGAALFVLSDWLPLVSVVVAFIAAGMLMAALPGRYVAGVDETETASLVGQITLGLKYVWAHPALRPLALTVAVFSFLNEASDSIFVILVTDRFGVGEIGFGVLISVDAAAAVITSFFVSAIVRRIGHAGSMRVSVLLYVFGSMLFGFGTSVGFAIAASVFMGLSNPMWNVVSSTIRQRLVPDHIFGRMMTAYLFIAWGVQPLGALTGGLVARTWGPEWVYRLTVLALLTLFFAARPMFAAVTKALRSDDP